MKFISDICVILVALVGASIAQQATSNTTQIATTNNNNSTSAHPPPPSMYALAMLSYTALDC